MWDMPTGILRDIWIALSSLGDYQTPKLEKIWVRLHDNRAALSEAELAQTNTAPQPAQAAPGQASALASAQGTPYQNLHFGDLPRLVLAKNHREEPNFSIMPSLRSLTVLDIDEIAYLEELSVLLERSLGKLRVRIFWSEFLFGSKARPHTVPLGTERSFTIQICLSSWVKCHVPTARGRFCSSNVSRFSLGS